MGKRRILRSTLTAVGFGLVVGGAAGTALATQEIPDPALAEARTLVAQGSSRDALILLKKTVRQSPNDLDARHALGLLEFQLGDLIGADKELSIVRLRHGSPGIVEADLARVYLAEGKFQQILDSIPPCPDNLTCKSDVLWLHARARMGLKDPMGAENDVRASLAVQPASVPAQVTLGMLLLARQDLAGAEKIADDLLPANPGFSELLALKAEARRQVGDFATAAQYFEKAVTASPHDPRMRMHLALVYMALNRNDDARAEVGRVLSADPRSVTAVYLKALLLTRDGKFTQALDSVQSYEQQLTEDNRGLFLLTMAHYGAGHLEQALSYAKRYHSVEPNDLAGVRVLSTLLYRQGAFAQVIALLAPLRDRLTGDGEGLDLLGSAYLAQGWIKQANEVLSEAVKLRPDNLQAQGRLALAQTRQPATRAEGIHELESLAAKVPDGAALDLALISSHVANGEYDEAVAAAAAMSTRQPKSPVPPTLGGAARLSKGDESGAMADFNRALTLAPTYTPAALYRAEILMRSGDFPAARQTLDAVIALSPGDEQALVARAQIERRANQTAAMLPFLKRTILGHPDDLEPRQQLIQALLELHDGAQASAAIHDLTQSLGKNPNAIDLAARALVALGKPDEAITLYLSLQTLTPNQPQVHERLGALYLQTGQTDAARVAFDRAISADPSFLPAWRDRIGQILRTRGLPAALDQVSEAQKQNATNEAFKLLTGDTYAFAGEMVQAEQAYRKQFEQSPSTLSLLRLYGLLARRGDSAAAALARSWIDQHPNDLAARSAIAEQELAQGDLRTAQSDYEFIAARLPRNVLILNNLAWLYDKSGHPAALETARQAYQLAPGVAQVADTYANLLYRKGDASRGEVQRGEELLRQDYATAPQTPQIAYHWARVLADHHDREGARAVLKPLIEAKAHFDESDDAAKFYASLGDPNHDH